MKTEATIITSTAAKYNEKKEDLELQQDHKHE